MSCSSHDTAYFEEQGVPTANVATTEFTEAGRIQYANLGYPSYDIFSFRIRSFRKPRTNVGQGRYRGRSDSEAADRAAARFALSAPIRA